MKAAAVLALMGLAAACSVDTSEPEPGSLTLNECEHHSDCGSEGRCEDGKCRARMGTLSSVLLEVAVPGTATASRFAGARYLIQRDDLSLEGGSLEIALPDLVQLRAEVLPPPCEDAAGEAVPRVEGRCPEGSWPPSGVPLDCGYDFGVTKIDAVFTPRERFLGIPSSPTTIPATCGAGDCGVGLVEGRLPPGTYEIYLRPQETDAVSGFCTPPPQVFEVTLAGATVSSELSLNAPSVFRGTVEYPVGNAAHELQGWSIDVLDPVSGRRISTVQNLTADPALTDVQSYPFEIQFAPMPDALGNLGNELVRLKPRDGVVAPMVIMERSALELFPGDVVIRHLTKVPQKVRVEGQLFTDRPDSPEEQLPIPGTVTLVASEIDLGDGVLPSFRTSVDANGDGDFTVELLPGRYRVLAIPPASCPSVSTCRGVACECPLASTEVEWIVSEESVQAGKTIELVRRETFEGTVTTDYGLGIVGAEVLAVPVPLPYNALASTLGVEPFRPRAASARVEAGGRYALSIDRGLFDLSVRPEGTTGFSWIVRPDLLIDTNQWDQHLSMPLPVAYAGRLTVAGAVLTDAVIRAYTRRDDGEASSGLVQVGQATSKAEGRFELLLPAALSRP